MQSRLRRNPRVDVGEADMVYMSDLLTQYGLLVTTVLADLVILHGGASYPCCA